MSLNLGKKGLEQLFLKGIGMYTPGGTLLKLLRILRVFS